MSRLFFICLPSSFGEQNDLTQGLSRGFLLLRLSQSLLPRLPIAQNRMRRIGIEGSIMQRTFRC